MAVDIPGWEATASLESRFFVDDGLWRDAPLLVGQGRFEPLSTVKNVLVTGGEGFMGSWLVRHLATKYSEAYSITSFDKLDHCSSLNNSRMLKDCPNFRFVHGDITLPADVLKCLRKFNVDTIFHLAAQTHVDLSFGNSFNFTKNNVFGTHVLLDCAKVVGTVKRFYHISTDEVYGEVDIDAGDLKEHSVLDPTNPYAATKAAAEKMVTAYAKSFKLPVVIVRLNNLYGPHQYPEKLIPKFMNLLQRKMPLFIHGDGKHSRRFLYAGDAADAFDTILHKGELGQIYNVDSRDEVSNLEVARKLLAMFGFANSDTWIKYTRDRPFNDRRYAVDGSKLRALGWTQKISFEDGLMATMNWYSTFSNWWGPIDDTLLSPFPVVRGDRVVNRECADEMVKQVEVGALDSRTPNMADDHIVNGLDEPVAKKRKADFIA